MGIDFGAMPPEVTSALMYTGPGSSSMMAAASAWSALAAELASTAQGYDKVATQLASEEWLGPSSAVMAAAVQPYVAWMISTGAQAEQSAIQIQSAAAAFEAAFAGVVPPPMIAANRVELTEALQTNIFGLNNGVIAQLEAQYAEMWAQNAGTMYSYAASSATASQVTPFTTAPEIANPAASSLQSTATASSLPPSIQQVVTAITTRLQSLSNPFVGNGASLNTALQQIWFLLTGQTVVPTNMGSLLNGYNPYSNFFYNTEGLPYFSIGMTNMAVQIAKSSGALGGAAPAAAAAAPKITIPSLGAGLGNVGNVGGQIAAGLGNGAHVGHLAVPASWPGATTAPPAVRAVVQAVSEPITAADSGPASLVGGIPAGMGGAGRGSGAAPRYGFKPTIMARPMPAG
jgi:PPE-repeat protein